MFFPPIDNPMQVLTEHECGNSSCSSCSFVKNDNGEITGCKCGDSGTCSHTVKEDDSGVSASEILEIVVLTLELLLMI